MPTVDIDTDELRELTGHGEKSDDDLRDDLFELGLEYEGETEDGELRFEFEPDRLDRLSVEGVARSLRYQYGDSRGVYVPKTNDADWTIRVEDVPEERPYVTGAVVRGLDLDEASLDSLIQLQEKLHATIGRKRAKGAIGVHDLTMLKGGEAADDSEGKSVRYTGIDRDGDTFVPLEGDAEMTPGEVLSEHHIGEEYADLVAEYDRVPAIYDSIGLFSFPPVVNGRRTEVSTDSRDLFIEMTAPTSGRSITCSTWSATPWTPAAGRSRMSASSTRTHPRSTATRSSAPISRRKPRPFPMIGSSAHSGSTCKART